MIKKFLFTFFTKLIPAFVAVLIVLLVLRRELYAHFSVTINSLAWLITLIFTYFVLVNKTLGKILKEMKQEYKDRQSGVSDYRKIEDQVHGIPARGKGNMTLGTQVIASIFVVGVLLFSIWAMLFGENASISFSTILLVAIVTLLIIGILWNLITAIRKSTRDT